MKQVMLVVMQPSPSARVGCTALPASGGSGRDPATCLKGRELQIFGQSC